MLKIIQAVKLEQSLNQEQKLSLKLNLGYIGKFMFKIRNETFFPDHCKSNINKDLFVEEANELLPAKVVNVYFMIDSKGKDLYKVASYFDTDEQIDIGRLTSIIRKYYFDRATSMKYQIYDPSLNKISSGFHNYEIALLSS